MVDRLMNSVAVALIPGYPVWAFISYGVFLKWEWDGVGAFYGALVWPVTWLVYLGWWLA